MPGSDGNVVGKVFGLLVLTETGVAVLISGGRSVVKPSGVTTAPNSRCSFSVIVCASDAGAGASGVIPWSIATCVLEPCGAFASPFVCAVRTCGPCTLAAL